MRILVTNDDGIDAKGLLILRQALAPLGEIYTVAPAQEQSGSGHGITVHRPIKLWPVTLTDPAGPAWVVDGLPADCTKLAIEELFKDTPPDLVVSGINHGHNLATDSIYSGTVAAALEGFIYGIPAIAVSLAGEKTTDDFNPAAQMVLQFCKWWIANDLQPNTMFNINVPVLPLSEIKGIKFTRLGIRKYTNAFSLRASDETGLCYEMWGTPYDDISVGNTDIEALENGYVSATPLGYDLTDLSILSCLMTERGKSFE